MEPGRLPRRSLAGIFLLALAVRLALGFALLDPAHPVEEDPLAGDALAYLSIAKNWLDRGEFATAPGEPTSHRMPLYPAFLAGCRWLFGSWGLAPKLLQVLMGSATACLGACLGALLFGRTAGILAGVGLAADPFLVYYDFRLWSESPFIFLTTAIAVHYAAMERRPGYGLRPEIVGGILIGAATLTRPDAAILALFLAPWARARLGGGWGRAARLVGIALAIEGLMLLPWQIRNWKVQGTFVPLTTEGGFILWQTNNLETLTRPELRGFWYPWPGHPEAVYTQGPDLARDERFADLDLGNEAAVDRRCKELVHRFWIENLGSMPRYVLYKWMRFFQISPAFDLWSSAQAAVYRAWYVPLLGLFVVGVALDLADKRRGALLYALLAFFFFKAVLFHINTRYRLQIEPILVVFAAFAVARGASASVSRLPEPWRTRAGSLLGLAAGADPRRRP